jgi:arylformamidase
MTDSLKASEWIDVTRPVYVGVSHWPGDPDVEIERIADMRRGDHCNVSRLNMCVHTGTHIDAPQHFIKDGATAEAAPLGVMIGPAKVIEIEDPVSRRRAAREAEDIRPGDRILFRTRNTMIPWESPFQMDFIYLAADAAHYLAEKKISLVGVDGMSVGGFYNDMIETHVALLDAGIWIIENLDLRKIKAGPCEIISLPMKLVGTDGAPARVLIRQI